MRVGKAQFRPDNDDTWKNAVHKVRPAWLDVFRHFPCAFPTSTVKAEAEPAVVRGTLLISDDDDWLRRNVENLIPVVYVLGLLQSHPLPIPPAEAFQYGGFLASDRQEDQVILVTKFGEKIESGSSLKLFPPAELRGEQPEYLVEIGDHADFEAAEELSLLLRCPPSLKVLNWELVHRLDQDPNDRIVMACYHLFHSQFANEFMSPVRQDYAAFCASLEAALDIDGTQRDVGARITRRLESLYPDLAGFDVWIKGLYAERSIFVHGASQRHRRSMIASLRRFASGGIITSCSGACVWTLSMMGCGDH